MKTFSRFRTPKELKAACKKAGFKYAQLEFERGGDCISFEFRHGAITVDVCMNTVNGRAFGSFWRGTSGKRSQFSTSGTAHEHLPWFQALLEFIYVA